MFYNREKELRQIQNIVNAPNERCKGILLYGRRRCGKTALVREALKDFDGYFIEFECAETLFDINIRNLASLAAETLGLGFLASINNLIDLVKAIEREKKKIVLFIDEYQFLRKGYKDGNLDSIFQIAIDQLAGNMTIILCGSYISIMRELENSDNPLYGRFDLTLHLKPFNYIEASKFYPDCSIREKIEFFSVFGGMPFALEKINNKESLEENIKNLLLEPSSPVYIVIKETLLKEIFKIDQAVAILSEIGNGKVRNSELASSTNTSSSLIAQETNRLLDMEILQKAVPINRKDDKKKTFYEIADNLIRFYYAFIQSHTSELQRFGKNFFWERHIKPSIGTFISKRFENIVSEYFTLALRNNPDLDILDIGTYWYDIPKKRINGEFDTVLKRSKGYMVIESKHYKDPISEDIIRKEIEEIKAIPDLQITNIGFASSSGFDYSNNALLLLTGNDIYDEESIKNGNVIRKYLS